MCWCENLCFLVVALSSKRTIGIITQKGERRHDQTTACLRTGLYGMELSRSPSIDRAMPLVNFATGSEHTQRYMYLEGPQYRRDIANLNSPSSPNHSLDRSIFRTPIHPDLFYPLSLRRKMPDHPLLSRPTITNHYAHLIYPRRSPPSPASVPLPLDPGRRDPVSPLPTEHRNNDKSPDQNVPERSKLFPSLAISAFGFSFDLPLSVHRLAFFFPCRNG